jgi:LDH2 family malate/lactate/ureidoglycolate dehydrogenase
VATPTGHLALPLEPLRRFACQVYQRLGVPPADAETIVEAQLEADLRGVDTHGLQRLPWYVGYLQRGENNPCPQVRVVHQTPFSLLVDGDNGLGQLVCTRAVELALAKARQQGLALCGVRRSNDWGCGAVYALRAARAGLLCFATTTSVPLLAPYGSRTRLLGNNPMVFAVPRGQGPPLVLDMALTPVAMGKVLRAQAEGRPIPAEWGFQDRDGRPTSDPAAALRGIIPAIGAYKGTGLSLMMNLLAGVLPGGHQTSEVGPGRRGHFFLLFSPDVFGQQEAFYEQVERLVQQVKGAEPLPGVAEVFLPGEIEERAYQQRLAQGVVLYPASLVAELRQLGSDLGVPFPA